MILDFAAMSYSVLETWFETSSFTFILRKPVKSKRYLAHLQTTSPWMLL